MQEEAQVEAQLYVVATPIGNLRDITLRAIDVLKTVDFIAAEDTRVTGNLLRAYGISAHMIALHKHNERETAEKILRFLQEGKVIAVVSDAGTPGISDPGSLLIRSVKSAGFLVTPIPGACAAIAALSGSGLSENGFLFYGFLPARTSARHTSLNELRTQTFPLVFYEAPHRIIALADDLLELFGPDRTIVFAREITKRFESIHVCNSAEAPSWLREDANRQRGEFVVIVSGYQTISDPTNDESKRVLEILLADLPLSQAASIAAKITGGKKNELYELALQINNKGE